MKYKILFGIMLMWGFAAVAQNRPSIIRSPESVEVRDARVKFTYNMIFPIFTDTTEANTFKGNDSLGAHIQIRSTGVVWHRVISSGTVKKWLATTAPASAGVWGGITGTLTDQTDLVSALAGKQNLLTLGTTAQYFDGTLALRTFPTNLSAFTNGPGYITGVTAAQSVGGLGTSGSPLTFVNDLSFPGLSKYYGTDGGGTKGWYNLPTGGGGGGGGVSSIATASPVTGGTITATGTIGVDTNIAHPYGLVTQYQFQKVDTLFIIDSTTATAQFGHYYNPVTKKTTMFVNVIGGGGGGVTNIGQASRNANNVLLTSSTGTGTTIDSATTAFSGVTTALQRRWLDSLRLGLYVDTLHIKDSVGYHHYYNPVTGITTMWADAAAGSGTSSFIDPYDYGARPDGTDQTVIFQKTADSAFINHKIVLMLHPGRYSVNDIYLAPGTHWFGSKGVIISPYLATMKVNSRIFNLDALKINPATGYYGGGTNYTPTRATGPKTYSDIVIEGLTFDGLMTNMTMIGITDAGNWMRFSDITVQGNSFTRIGATQAIDFGGQSPKLSDTSCVITGFRVLGNNADNFGYYQRTAMLTGAAAGSTALRIQSVDGKNLKDKIALNYPFQIVTTATGTDFNTPGNYDKSNAYYGATAFAIDAGDSTAGTLTIGSMTWTSGAGAQYEVSNTGLKVDVVSNAKILIPTAYEALNLQRLPRLTGTSGSTTMTVADGTTDAAYVPNLTVGKGFNLVAGGADGYFVITATTGTPVTSITVDHTANRNFTSITPLIAGMRGDLVNLKGDYRNSEIKGNTIYGARHLVISGFGTYQKGKYWDDIQSSVAIDDNTWKDVWMGVELFSSNPWLHPFTLSGESLAAGDSVITPVTPSNYKYVSADVGRGTEGLLTLNATSSYTSGNTIAVGDVFRAGVMRGHYIVTSIDNSTPFALHVRRYSTRGKYIINGGFIHSVTNNTNLDRVFSAVEGANDIIGRVTAHNNTGLGNTRTTAGYDWSATARDLEIVNQVSENSEHIPYELAGDRVIVDNPMIRLSVFDSTMRDGVGVTVSDGTSGLHSAGRIALVSSADFHLKGGVATSKQSRQLGATSPTTMDIEMNGLGSSPYEQETFEIDGTKIDGIGKRLITSTQNVSVSGTNYPISWYKTMLVHPDVTYLPGNTGPFFGAPIGDDNFIKGGTYKFEAGAPAGVFMEFNAPNPQYFPTPKAMNVKDNIFSDPVPYSATAGAFVVANNVRGNNIDTVLRIKDSAGVGHRWVSRDSLVLYANGSGGGTTTTNTKETFLGTLYRKATFASTSDFTANGATIGVSSGHLNISGGNGSFLKTANLTSYGASMLEYWKISGIIKPTITPGATTYGIGFGMQSINSNGSGLYDGLGRLDFSSNGSQGTITLNGGNGDTQLGVTPSGATIANGDTIYFTVERIKDTLKAYYFNKTQNTFKQISYVYDVNPGFLAPAPNTGYFSIYTFGGTQEIDSLSITSRDIKNASLMVLGNSKVQGYYAGSWSRRFSEQLSAYYQSTAIHAGGYDHTAEMVAALPEIKSLNPKSLLISDITSNDQRDGISSATYNANLKKIYDSATSWGINTFVTTPFYETSIDQSAQVTNIINNYSGRYVDVWSAIKNKSGSLSADGVHPNAVGQDTIFSTILKSHLVPGAIKPLSIASNTAPGLKSVTDSGNSTDNMIRITGVNKVPATGGGLELYYSPSDQIAYIDGFDRGTSSGLQVSLSPNALNTTFALPAGTAATALVDVGAGQSSSSQLGQFRLRPGIVSTALVPGLLQHATSKQLFYDYDATTRLDLMKAVYKVYASTDSVYQITEHFDGSKDSTYLVGGGSSGGGGGGGTPTFQQVLTSGSTLTTTNTISIGSNSLVISASGPGSGVVLPRTIVQGINYSAVPVTGSYSATLDDDYIYVNANSTTTVTLPAFGSGSSVRKVYHIIRTDATGNTLSVISASGTILGPGGTITGQYTWKDYVNAANGADYYSK